MMAAFAGCVVLAGAGDSDVPLVPAGVQLKQKPMSPMKRIFCIPKCSKSGRLLKGAVFHPFEVAEIVEIKSKITKYRAADILMCIF